MFRISKNRYIQIKRICQEETVGWISLLHLLWHDFEFQTGKSARSKGWTVWLPPERINCSSPNLYVDCRIRHRKRPQNPRKSCSFGQIQWLDPLTPGSMPELTRTAHHSRTPCPFSDGLLLCWVAGRFLKGAGLAWWSFLRTQTFWRKKWKE